MPIFIYDSNVAVDVKINGKKEREYLNEHKKNQSVSHKIWNLLWICTNIGRERKKWKEKKHPHTHTHVSNVKRNEVWHY